MPPKPIDGHPGAHRVAGGPGLRLERHPQRRPRSGELGMGVVVSGGRRDDLVVDGEHRLEQAGDSGGSLGVTDVSLHRADGSRRRLRVGRPACRGECPQLGLVADGGAGAMSLEVADGLDAESRGLVGTLQRELVPGSFGTGDAALAVGGVAPAFEHGVAAQARAAMASWSRMSTSMPQPSPGQNPLESRSYTRISPEASAQVLAKPITSNGSMLRSTPPAMATSSWPDASALAAVATDSSEDEQAPSTVKPAAVQVEVVADASGDGIGEPTGQGVLVDGGKRALVTGLQPAQEAGRASASSQPCSRSSAPTVRRT